MPELLPPQTRQLALINYWRQRGVEQTKAAHGLDALAILQFHDAVEWFLLLAAEVWQVDAPRTSREFFQLWDAIAERLPNKRLQHRESMKKVIEARNSLKHRGLDLRSDTLQELSATVRRFFEAETIEVFAIPFEQVSLLLLVQNERVKRRLSSAQSAASQGDYIEGMKHIALAFNQTRKPYELRQGVEAGIPGIDELSNRVARLEAVVDAIVSGLRPRAFLHFISLLPAVHTPWSGDPVVMIGSQYRPSADVFRFSEEFLLNYVLQTESQPSFQPDLTIEKDPQRSEE